MQIRFALNNQATPVARPFEGIYLISRKRQAEIIFNVSIIKYLNILCFDRPGEGPCRQTNGPANAVQWHKLRPTAMVGGRGGIS